MLKIIKQKIPLEMVGAINRLKMELQEETTYRTELEDAVIELGELFSEQDDALVELADMIEGGE